MTVAQTPGRSADAGARVDPITYEIVRHRLWSIADEMALTLIRTAGNPSITEAHDFMVALFTPDGDIALGGWGGNRHVSCTALAVRGILARFPLDDIHEDDVFLLNDPYIAAIHQPDVYVISPIHYDGALVGWTANFTHLPDIGGMDPGSSPRATEVVQEGLRVPGLRIADRGVLRQDIWDTILHNTREPEMNALQLKAQMAANNTGKEKVRALLAKVGVGQYHAIVAQSIAGSERALRARLRQLPDGTWRTREYFDTKDRLFTVELAMTKDGDELLFDFTGTSEQASSFINCTYWGARGGVFVSLSSMLGHGLPWNEGLLRPIRLVIPEGTLLNCAFPAPVSMGTLAGSRLATIASWSTVSAMLAQHDAWADEASALWTASATGHRVSGFNRQNRYFVLTPFTDVGGSGARAFADGIDTGGGCNNPMSAAPNVETLEHQVPFLYLFRRQLPDSGGPGAHRGGVSTDQAFTVHKAPAGKLGVVVYASGLDPAQSHGLFGGEPGCNTLFALHQNTRVRDALRHGDALDFDALGGTVERLPPQGLCDVDADAVFYVRADGGGGLGDPLRRPPAKVLADVQAGLVSPEQAVVRYGVVLDAAGGAVDEATTEALRSGLRAARLPPLAEQQSGGVLRFQSWTYWKSPATTSAAGKPGEPTTPSLSPPALGGPGGATPLTQPVRYDSTRDAALCAACERELAPLRENWKLRAVVQTQPLRALGPLMLSERFVLRSYSCPGCGALLDTEMTLPSDPPVHPYSPL
jgi:N-methylhydantoinase B